MLPQKNRIPRVLFARIHKNGAFFNSPHFSLILMRIHTDSPRFSFVVSKKVSKSAVHRNLLRRRGYSALQNILKHTAQKNTAGVVGAFFFKKGAEKLGFLEIQNEIALLLKKAKIL